jgi:hypothetical protein
MDTIIDIRNVLQKKEAVLPLISKFWDIKIAYTEKNVIEKRQSHNVTSIHHTTSKYTVHSLDKAIALTIDLLYYEE